MKKYNIIPGVTEKQKIEQKAGVSEKSSKAEDYLLNSKILFQNRFFFLIIVGNH